MCERRWATLSRQSVPIHNALLASTKSLLLNVQCNWMLLIVTEKQARPRAPCVDFVIPQIGDDRRAGPVLSNPEDPAPPATVGSADSSSSSSAADAPFQLSDDEGPELLEAEVGLRRPTQDGQDADEHQARDLFQALGMD